MTAIEEEEMIIEDRRDRHRACALAVAGQIQEAGAQGIASGE